MLSLLIAIICGLLLYTLSQGAPYVPTRRKEAMQALELLGLPKGATVVDIGAGDGAFLRFAAEKGYRAVGIEINPLLWLVAWLRTRRFKGQVKVICGNAWRWHVPADTGGIFFFTAGPFAARLRGWLRVEQAALGRPLPVVSHGFALPEETVATSAGACVKYVLE